MPRRCLGHQAGVCLPAFSTGRWLFLPRPRRPLEGSHSVQPTPEGRGHPVVGNRLEEGTCIDYVEFCGWRFLSPPPCAYSVVRIGLAPWIFVLVFRIMTHRCVFC